MLTRENAATTMTTVSSSLPSYPDRFDGRGIVIPGGGMRYFTCAWVCIRMLRSLGCTLPIELWHCGPEEMKGMRTSGSTPKIALAQSAELLPWTSISRILSILRHFNTVRCFHAGNNCHRRIDDSTDSSARRLFQWASRYKPAEPRCRSTT